MSIEEILKPRWKVIASYPHCPYMIGDLLKGNDEELHLTTTSCGGGGQLHNVDNCCPANILSVMSHLFGGLGWWQERKPEDMPEYVKHEKGFIAKVKSHFCNSLGEENKFGCQLDIETEWNYYSYSRLQPATESEYLEYINTH